MVLPFAGIDCTVHELFLDAAGSSINAVVDTVRFRFQYSSAIQLKPIGSILHYLPQ